MTIDYDYDYDYEYEHIHQGWWGAVLLVGLQPRASSLQPHAP